MRLAAKIVVGWALCAACAMAPAQAAKEAGPPTQSVSAAAVSATSQGVRAWAREPEPQSAPESTPSHDEVMGEMVQLRSLPDSQRVAAFNALPSSMRAEIVGELDKQVRAEKANVGLAPDASLNPYSQFVAKQPSIPAQQQDGPWQEYASQAGDHPDAVPPPPSGFVLENTPPSQEPAGSARAKSNTSNAGPSAAVIVLIGIGVLVGTILFLFLCAALFGALAAFTARVYRFTMAAKKRSA